MAKLRGVPITPETRLGWPPGAAEEVAQFIFAAAPRPVEEVAIITALGFLAGVCGNAYTVSGDGLNGYFTLVARSAIGKEAMTIGIGLLLESLAPQDVPLFSQGSEPPLLFASDYIHFGGFASGPALRRECAERPTRSFVSVTGEWGKTLECIAQGRDGNAATLKQAMLDLYGKSGKGGFSGGIGYSDKERNVKSVRGVAYSQIGETTPDTFWNCLTDAMRADGFMSRFVVVAYSGIRPPLVPEEDRAVRPPPPTTAKLRELLIAAKTNTDRNQRTKVETAGMALTLLNAFDAECDEHINASEDEGVRQIWNRGHLKAWKVAAILAAYNNPKEPVIDSEQAQWAIDLVRRDIACYTEREAGGGIGDSDHVRERAVARIIHEYLTQPLPTSYGIPQAMQQDGIVPRKYIQLRSQRLATFSRHKLGAIRALDDTLRSMCANGYIKEPEKGKEMDKFRESYLFSGQCFRVLQLPNAATP